MWVKTGPRATFANLYVLLVAHPGVGKQVIEDVRDLWRETMEPGTKLAALKVAPDSVTKASLMDALVKAKGIAIPPQGPPVVFHTLNVAAEEFAVLMPSYDLEFIGVLNSIYNNKSWYEETRRTGNVREVKIEQPQLNILGGTQPGWLASVFPEEAWSTGLASRLIMVYAADVPLKDLFQEVPDNEILRTGVLEKLGKITNLWGQMQWEARGAECLSKWHMQGGPPQPQHSKLAHYVRRRSQHLIKLSMVSAISARGDLVIMQSDVERGIEWLVEAERLMPDIFRAMVGKSDAQIIEELHFFVTTLWLKSKREAVPERMLVGFLQQRVPSDKIDKILDISDRANIVCRVAGSNSWIPKPKQDHGME